MITQFDYMYFSSSLANLESKAQAQFWRAAEDRLQNDRFHSIFYFPFHCPKTESTSFICRDFPIL
jgi:hypothetical protein